MKCNELMQLLPDLIDGSLSEELRVEAEAALLECPDCQQQFDFAHQVHFFLVELQSENAQFRVPPGFEAKLLARVRRQHGNLDLLDLSAVAFAQWLVELINLIGGLIDPSGVNKSQLA